jgi:hypothetical protein
MRVFEALGYDQIGQVGVELRVVRRLFVRSLLGLSFGFGFATDLLSSF